MINNGRPFCRKTLGRRTRSVGTAANLNTRRTIRWKRLYRGTLGRRGHSRVDEFLSSPLEQPVDQHYSKCDQGGMTHEAESREETFAAGERDAGDAAWPRQPRAARDGHFRGVPARRAVAAAAARQAFRGVAERHA